MSQGRKQLGLDLEEGESLDVEGQNLEERGVVLEEELHKSRVLLVLIRYPFPVIVALGFEGFLHAFGKSFDRPGRMVSTNVKKERNEIIVLLETSLIFLVLLRKGRLSNRLRLLGFTLHLVRQ